MLFKLLVFKSQLFKLLVFKSQLFKLLVFKSQLFKLLLFKPQVATLHLRIALPAQQCTLLALRYIFDHSRLINIEKAKSTVQNVQCTICPVHIAPTQQASSLSNGHSEEINIDSMLSTKCQKRWKMKIFCQTNAMSNQPPFLEDIHPRTAQPSRKIPLLTEFGWVIMLFQINHLVLLLRTVIQPVMAKMSVTCSAILGLSPLVLLWFLAIPSGHFLIHLHTLGYFWSISITATSKPYFRF